MGPCLRACVDRAAATELLIKGRGAEREALDGCCEQQVTGTKLRLYVKHHLETKKLQDNSGHMSQWAGGHNYLVDLELKILTRERDT